MQQRNGRYFHALIFLFAGLGLIFLSVIGGLGWAANLYSRWIYWPSLSIASRLSQNSAIAPSGSTVEGEHRKLAGLAAEIDALKKENEALLRALILGGEHGRKVIPALSAGFFREIGADIIVINRGRESGISAGDPVMTAEKIYVGRVLRSGPDRSDVILASSRSQITDVLFLDKALRARANGKGGGEFDIDLLPQSVEIKSGDQFTVSPKAGDYASGLLFGEIREARSQEGSIFRNARAAHLFNPFQYSTLFVILSLGTP